MVKKTSKVELEQRATDRLRGRFALLPARDEVMTSAQVRHLAETSELTSQQQAPHVATTIRSLQKGRFSLDADLSDAIGDGRD
jgi:hypothetical protein